MLFLIEGLIFVCLVLLAVPLIVRLAPMIFRAIGEVCVLVDSTDTGRNKDNYWQAYADGIELAREEALREYYPDRWKS